MLSFHRNTQHYPLNLGLFAKLPGISFNKRLNFNKYEYVRVFSSFHIYTKRVIIKKKNHLTKLAPRPIQSMSRNVREMAAAKMSYRIVYIF